jgi:hypothetical protein
MNINKNKNMNMNMKIDLDTDFDMGKTIAGQKIVKALTVRKRADNALLMEVNV